METGRSVIESALRQRYPGQRPLATAAIDLQQLKPLEEVQVYRHPSNHWHYVSLGLSELGAKESNDPATSGWGFELTFRLQADGPDAGPPRWPMLMLQDLARYVYDKKAPFGDGHHMDLGEPVDEAAPHMTALAFARDSELGNIMTPNGALTFLQVITLRPDEERLMARWSVSGFLQTLAGQSPLLVCEPDRPSLLADPELGPLLQRRAETEGSAQSKAFAETLTWRSPFWSSRKLELFLGPIGAVRRNFGSMLEGRTRHGREFRVIGPQRNCLVRSGEPAAWQADDDVTLNLTVSPALADELTRFLEGDDLALQSSVLAGFTVRLLD